MSKRNVGIGLGVGAAGVIGYLATRLIVGNRKKRVAASPVEKKPAVELDARPKDITCPECSAPVREYEFFCPVCKYPMENGPHEGGMAAATAGKNKPEETK